MKIIIAGGGKVGYYLIKTLQQFDHELTIIEYEEELCEKLADELNIPVINGDATDLEFLSVANVYDADVFIAVTGQDEENLVACQLAKTNFRAKRTIARANNPKNIRLFKKLGVDSVVSSTSIIADLIGIEVVHPTQTNLEED